MLEEKRVSFRPMSEDDLVLMLKWLTDDRVLEFYDGRDKRHTQKTIREHYTEQWADEIYRVIIEYDTIPIGYAQIYRIQGELFDEYDYHETEEKIYAILEKVGLDREHATRFPHQFSGGQRQRIGIARALVMLPQLVIADECISALDVSIQAQVVNLMRDLQDELGITYLFIAHDLSMVKYISDRIGVLHLGHLLETGTTEEIFANPIHPYTRSLLSAIPLPNPVVEKRRVAETYDYATSGIDYSKGTSHHVEGSHYVKCTDEEFAKWCK